MSVPHEVITARTPAKINLSLEILRKRPDGYHEINSIFVPVPVFDTITVEARRDALTLHCDALHIPADAGNLVLRAATALREHLGRADRGAHIVLEKHIPVGAGLGGGSSDAACTLIMLNQLWGASVPPGALHEIARGLGADVPFFLAPQTSLVQGIGEIIAPLPLPFPIHVLLVAPDVAINTAWAYRQVSCDPPRVPANYGTLVPSMRTVRDFRDTFRNDFESFIFPHHPVLGELRDRLSAAGAAYAAMSGSGSTMFGVFETEEAMAAAATCFGEMRVFMCPGVR